MKPRHAFMVALLLGIGAYILIQRTWTPNVSVNNTPVAQTVQTASSNNQADNPSPTPSLSGEKIHLSDGLRFETVKLNIRRAKRKFSIKVQYPQLVSDRIVEHKRAQLFSHAVRHFIENEMKRDYAVYTDTRDLEKEMSEWADVEEVAGGDYEISYASDEVISVVFSVYFAPWGAGGAGGTPYVFNYDFQHSREIKSGELFKPRSNHVQTLISYCEPKLQERHGEMFFGMSFAERAGEYKYFGITKEGIAVIFPEYTFAPGSAGIHNVFVPYEVIKDKINPRSPLAKLAGVANE